MASILKDFLLPNTPFRGLIFRGDFALCAYIGVPESHWLADMESLQFECHWGVTFNGPGGDGIRPAGWHWYGWDYAHGAVDALDFPEEVRRVFEEAGLELPFQSGKRWTPEEVEHDIIDVALSLRVALDNAEQAAAQALQPKVVRGE